MLSLQVSKCQSGMAGVDTQLKTPEAVQCITIEQHVTASLIGWLKACKLVTL